MREIASRQLRNHTRAVLDSLEHDDPIVITVHGRPVARLTNYSGRGRWIPRRRFLSEILAHQADPGLAEDLAQLADEMTDDLPWE